MKSRYGHPHLHDPALIKGHQLGKKSLSCMGTVKFVYPKS